MKAEYSIPRKKYEKKECKVLLPDSAFPYPLAVKGEGIYIIGDDGKRYLDGSSGAYVSGIGHANPEVAEAIYKQCRELEFAHRTQFTTKPLLDMARLLTEIAPADLNAIYFTSSGAEANETAIKIARRFHILSGNPEKYVMLSRWLSYHGNTLGAQSLSGMTRLRDAYVPLLHDWPQVEPCYCFRCPFDKRYPECGVRCGFDLEDKILRIGPRYVAAFFVEPIVGSSCPGAKPPIEYFDIIRNICDKYNILLVADEVITSFGRVGRYYGVEDWNVVPDIITVGKGTSCGYAPLGATIFSERIYEVLHGKSGQFGEGHTLNFNPLSMAAGIAVQRYIRQHNLINKANEAGSYLFEKLNELAERHPVIGDIRGKGLLAGIELLKGKGEKNPFPAEVEISKKIAKTAMFQGLVIYPSRNDFRGKTLDFLSIAPPLIITKEEINELVTKLDASIERAMSEIKK